MNNNAKLSTHGGIKTVLVALLLVLVLVNQDAVFSLYATFLGQVIKLLC